MFYLVNRKADGGMVLKSTKGDILVEGANGQKQYWMADGRYLYEPSLMNLGVIYNNDGKGNIYKDDGKGNTVQKGPNGGVDERSANGNYFKRVPG